MLSAMLFDDPFSSPFIVPVSGTVMILGIVVAAIWSGVRARELQAQERLAAIAKGIPLPSSPGISLARQRATSRRVGLVLAFTGIGLAIFGLALAWIIGNRYVLTAAAAGLIPLGIGVGFLVDARLRSRELEQRNGVVEDADLRPLH